MTEVAFHFNAPDKAAYACRLLRKAVTAGARVVVTAEPDLLDRLDTQLWTFSALEFVAHCRLGADAATLARSPIVLAASAAEAPYHQVLVNLGERVADGFERYERVIEIVTLGDADRAAARQRWRHYADRGYAIVRHDLQLKETA